MTSRTPARPAFLQVGEEAAPEHLVLGVADVEAEDFAAAVGGDSGGDDHGHRDHLWGGVADMQVGRVEVDIGELGVVQPSGAERGDDLVQPGADPRDLGLGDPGVDPQRGDQVVDGSGGDPADVGLHHHRIQGLVDPAASLAAPRRAFGDRNWRPVASWQIRRQGRGLARLTG